MKWKVKELPKQEDVRFKRKFAWIPIKLDGYFIFFEFYYVKQKYARLGHYTNYNWIDIERFRDVNDNLKD